MKREYYSFYSRIGRPDIFCDESGNCAVLPRLLRGTGAGRRPVCGVTA